MVDLVDDRSVNLVLESGHQHAGLGRDGNQTYSPGAREMVALFASGVRRS